ncbi:hypothetical protein DdX_03232 [Ditylenchus destructor]|uniref:Uncharacterized protein n=1 Tax=Ditylenchus destructor TaxID=166010 RepID=A0AAD4R6Q3_9BILA|nr:hypothetical protein DdX_03232 [Ditylenchus destructor]
MVGQSVDFDYNGPPINVNNGTALELVRNFGIQNAWYAFLKLRGMNLSKEDADKAEALKRFRSKIRRLKKTSESLKEKPDDYHIFAGKEFGTFLQPDSLELRKDSGSGSEDNDDANDDSTGEDEAVAVPTTSSLLEVLKGATASESKPPAENTEALSHCDFKPAPPVENAASKRHQETIDDVVSSIMNKIRNNLPFEGELSSATSALSPPATSRSTKKAGRNAQSKGTKGSKTNLITSPKTEEQSTVFSPAFPTTTTMSDQVTILSNFNDIIRASTSTAHPQLASPSHTKIIGQSSPHQITQIPIATAQYPFAMPFATINIPGMPAQGITLPTNITVQALLQSLQQQAKKTQFHLQPQQETPDSSQDVPSTQQQQQEPQNALQTGIVPQSATVKKRAPAKKKTVEKVAVPETSKKPVKSEPAVTKTDVEESKLTAPLEKAKASPKATKPKGTAAKQKASAESETKAVQEANDENLKRIAELESQLSKAQKQLAAEKNKFINQKKKLDKVQADLEKNADAIQLVQIDLACQKTDNNNLTAENIALKAENQQLRSKGASTKTPPMNKSKGKSKPGETSNSPSKDAKSGFAKPGPSSRNGKRAHQSPESSAEDQSYNPIPEAVEYGRRQSKRICVSRSKYLYPVGY